MKCLILAGGKGDRLWPLSRGNYPKQFIQLQKNHSLFQETVARNLPFCDEFIVSTSADCQYIVENQMQAFPATPYRCIFEGEGRKTTASIVLACMQLEPSELVFVVSSDQLISGNAYTEDILKAREYAKEGKIVAFGIPMNNPETRFGYIRFEGDEVLQFVEKPDRETMQGYVESGDYLINSGMFLFRNYDFLQEVRTYAEDIYQECLVQFKEKKVKKGNAIYEAEQLRQITAAPIEKTVMEQTQKAMVVHAGFDWQDVGDFRDLGATDSGTDDFGRKMIYESENVHVINQSPNSIVVADGLKDVTIVNAKDAVYVGKTGDFENLKIFAQQEEVKPFFENSNLIFRAWGTREILVESDNYRVRRVIIKSGKSIYSHKHHHRTEMWAIISGKVKVTVDGVDTVYDAGDTFVIERNTYHQLSNISEDSAILIETTSGITVSEEDIVSDDSRDLTDKDLGFYVDSFVRLSPTFKENLWGGTRLKDEFGKKSDFDIIAESWELSAHPAGQSIVASGRHKGRHFATYLQKLGKEYWGWKCDTNNAFPVMIKFIDARENLSIQVHPDDEYALEVEGEYGKNEMWYIMDAEEGAGIYCGFKEDVTREEVELRIKENTLLDALNWVETKPGDVFFIPAGTVHAIGAGNLICEVQQSSNSIYRLYDYARKDKFGLERELHIEKALDVMNYNKYVPQSFVNEKTVTEEFEKRLVTECKYFTCQEYSIKTQMQIRQETTSFTALVCLDGSGEIYSEERREVIKAGDSFFVPAGEKTLHVEGQCKLLVVRV